MRIVKKQVPIMILATQIIPYLCKNIKKMKKNEIIDKNQRIAELILNNHFLLLVLERFEVSLGVQEKTIEKICEENSINLSLFLSICDLHLNINSNPEIRLERNDVQSVINYLYRSHEYYKEEVLPKISKQTKLISENTDDLLFVLVERFFEEYKTEVLKHLEYEEVVVYPYAKDLLNGSFSSSDYKIKDYKNHHQDIETKLYDLKNLLIKYLPDRDDQNLRRDLLFELFRFEKDLRIHTVIEEAILVPAIETFEKGNDL